MTRDIKVSPKHGVNPTMVKCYVCGEPTNEIALLGRLPGDAESPHYAVLDKRPCEVCQHWMKEGVILISVRDGESGDDPYRTGGWCVVKDDAIRTIITPQSVADDILEHRTAFVPDAAWDAMGLPRTDKPAKGGAK